MAVNLHHRGDQATFSTLAPGALGLGHAWHGEVARQRFREIFPAGELEPETASAWLAASCATIGEVALVKGAGGGFTVGSRAPAHYTLLVNLSERPHASVAVGDEIVALDGCHAVVTGLDPVRARIVRPQLVLGLRVPPALVKGRLLALSGRAVTAAPRFAPGVEPGAGLARLIGFLAAEIERMPALLQARTVMASWQDLLLACLVTRLPHSASGLLVPTSPRAGPWQLRAAEAWLEAHAAEPITMDDLAAAIGVPLRTIQHAFHARGSTPRRFLRQCRLELARRRLTAAATGDTVTGIALDCGFGHFGDFAARYRVRFGESPSATLRRHR
jgi:AraC-like DNA-binding protein